MYSDKEDYEDGDYDNGGNDASDASKGIVKTVPAKKPRMDAVTLEPALKKPGTAADFGKGGTPQNGEEHSSASIPPQEENQNSRWKPIAHMASNSYNIIVH